MAAKGLLSKAAWISILFPHHDLLLHNRRTAIRHHHKSIGLLTLSQDDVAIVVAVVLKKCCQWHQIFWLHLLKTGKFHQCFNFD